MFKIPNCGNVGSDPPLPDSCGSAQLFPWQFGGGKLTPHMNVTTAPTLSSGIHLPVTASIYVRSPSRSLRPSDSPPLKPPPCVTVVHLPEVTPAIGFFLFLFTICQPTSCFKLLYFPLAVGDSLYNIQGCVALTKGGGKERGGGYLS